MTSTKTLVEHEDQAHSAPPVGTRVETPEKFGGFAQPGRSASASPPTPPDSVTHPILPIRASLATFTESGQLSRAKVMRSWQTTIGNARVNQMIEPGQLPASVMTALQSGGGRPLDRQTRGSMERSFGADFSGVRVHTDAHAATAARDINARAFTTGQEIFFGDGQFKPHDRDGQKLLAHELTHTLQQGREGTQPQTDGSISKPEDPSEREADSVAEKVTRKGVMREAIVGDDRPHSTIATRPESKSSERRQVLQREVTGPDSAPPVSNEQIPVPTAPSANVAPRIDQSLNAPTNDRAMAGANNRSAAPPTAPGPAARNGNSRSTPAPQGTRLSRPSASQRRPALDSRPSIDLDTNNPIHSRAAEILKALSSRANEQAHAAQQRGAEARGGLEAVYEQARATATNSIAAAHTNLAAAIETQQQQVTEVQISESSRTTAQAEAAKTQMLAEGRRGAEQTTALGTQETGRAHGEAQATAGEAQHESENRSAHQSQGILGRLKAMAFGRVGAEIARSIFAGLTRVVDAIRQSVNQVIDSILQQVTQIIDAVSAAVAATLEILPRLAQSVLEHLGSLQGELSGSLNRVDQEINAKFDQSHILAISALDDAEGSAMGQIQEIHGGGVVLIEKILEQSRDTSGESEGATRNDAEINNEIIATLDQVGNDCDGALSAIGDGLGHVMDSHTGGALADGERLLTTLHGGLNQITTGITGRLTAGITTVATTLRQIVEGALGMVTNVVSAVQRGVGSAIAAVGQHVASLTGGLIGDARSHATSPQVYSDVEQRTIGWFNSQPGVSMIPRVNLAPIQPVRIQRGFWSGVGKELLGFLSSILMLFGAAVALVVIACIPIIGPILVGIAIIAIVLLLLWGLAQPFIEQWNRMEQVGVPVWLRVILVPFIGFADLIGAIPLLEGIFGIELPTGRELSSEERGHRVTRGIIDLLLTFGTFGIGRALKGVSAGTRAARAIGWVERGLEAIRRLRWVEEALEGLSRLFRKWRIRRPPPTPRVIRSAEMGRIIGWGTGQSPAAVEQTRQVTRTLTAESVREMIAKGLTREWVEEQLAFYNRAIATGGDKLKNTQLLARKELMERLLSLWP